MRRRAGVRRGSVGWRRPGATAAAILFLVGVGAPRCLAAETPPFHEAAAESGLDFVHFNGMSGELYMVEIMGGGAALLDYDNDGDLDVFLVQGRMLGPGKTVEDAIFSPRHALPLTDRLYRNDGWRDAKGEFELSFTDVTAEAIPESTGYGMGVAAADYDNDGWVDLYVTNYGSNQMLRNNGDGSFADATETTGTGDQGWSVSAAFVDYDMDGWLDLFVGNYLEYTLGGRPGCAAVTGAPDYCSPLNFPPQKDVLYRNNGDGSFTDSSAPAGIAGEFGPALGVVAADFSGDALPDVYVANDATENQLWVNQGNGLFANDALLMGCAVNETGLPEGSMGVAVADLDGNETLDLFMTHIAQETNTLYLNTGRGVFREGTRRSGLGVVSRAATGFGTAAIDYDKDGWLDLYVANGTVQKIPALVAAKDPYPLRQPDRLFRNRGQAGFDSVAAGGEPSGPQVGRGVAAGDLDRDGDDDLVVVDSAAPVRLLVNRHRTRNAWLGLTVGESWAPFRHALGATVLVETETGRRLLRRIATDGSYASASAPDRIVGLGAADSRIVAVTVALPDGRKSRWIDLPADRRVTLAPTESRAR